MGVSQEHCRWGTKKRVREVKQCCRELAEDFRISAVNLFGLQLHLDVNVYDSEAIVLLVSAVCREEACIELFQMPISLKMCYVIITCNEVLFKSQQNLHPLFYLDIML